MLRLGKKQWIIVAGSLLVLGSGLGVLAWLDLEAAKAYLDFAGSFGWKAIAAVSGGAALGDGLRAIANGKKAG